MKLVPLTNAHTAADRSHTTLDTTCVDEYIMSTQRVSFMEIKTGGLPVN